MSNGNFEWVREIETLEWSVDGRTRSFKMEIVDLIRRSGLTESSDWKVAFEHWASDQSEEFKILPMVNISTGETLAVMIVEVREEGADRG